MGSVLIADDDVLVRRVLRAALERRGHRVAEADDGDTLLALLHAEEHSLCIMDARMPGASLQDRLDRLRRLRPDLRVIVLSGFVGEQEDMAAALVRFVRKPIDLAELDEILAEAALPGAGR